MLKPRMVNWRGNEQGDTLIEVTFALVILGAVLVGSTAAVTLAFRTGQTANERTEVAEAAQSQLEGLRSFRDNHTWAQFRQGQNCGAGGYCGVDEALSTIPSTPCVSGAPGCFHMELLATGPGVTEWIPVAGPMDSTTPNTNGILTVPTSTMEITSASETALPDTRPCGYDFVLHYSFNELGGSVLQSSEISTELVNLQYTGGSACP